jgi:hypothetical protein
MKKNEKMKEKIEVQSGRAQVAKPQIFPPDWSALINP